MKKMLWALFASSLGSFPASAQTPLPPAATVTVDYDKDVKPLFAQHCYSCHGPEAQQSGLRLDLRQNALRGGDYGPVIIAGKSAESKLIRRLVDGDGGIQMPPSGPLTPEEVGLLRAWIDQGAEFRTTVEDEAPARPLDPALGAIISAVRSGPRNAVERLLADNPARLKDKDPSGSTLLHHAAAFGSLETMRVLLEAGAEVNAANRRRSTPLHWAIADEAKVRLLLGRGANVNARVVEGRTPLFLATQLGNPYGVMRALLEHGADPNIASAAGQTPLMISATRGDLEAIKLLLDAKANINAKNGAGETALMAAATDGNPLVVRLMLERGADAKVLSKRNESALGNAATSGNEETVRLLLDRGADFNSRNVRGYSPLMLAASSDTMPAGVVKLLLARGANASFTGDYDETARDMAAKRGDTEVTRLLGGMKAMPAAMATHQTATRRSIPDAVERAMAMVEKQSFNFIRIGGCNSCHSQDLTSAVNGFAKTRGLRVPREIPQLPDSMLAPPDRIVDLNVVNVAGMAWELFDVGMNGMPRNDFTDATVRLIKVSQLPQGYWAANEGRRPPMNAGEIQGAALAIYALKHYTPPGDEASSAEAIQRAAAWLDRATPRNTQDRAFQLLGLAWADGNAESIKRGARALVATQRPDGGWSQLATTGSDSYATGQALFALNTAARLATSDAVYQKGIEYLLRTQAEDGTWHVKSRSIWLQPYFESGFPYGQDQFISTAGTAWAAMALATAVPPTTTTESAPKR
jgi:ankyrin repeat protein/mono/diheme cytochrome c family protein